MSSVRVVLKRAALVTLGVVIAAVLALLAYVRLNETDLVYPRVVTPGGTAGPAPALALPYESVYFTTADSVRLNAWVVPAGGADSSGLWILLCHGATGNIATTVRPKYYAHLRGLGVNILAFDWRGFGASEGTPSEPGLYRDASAAYAYLRDSLRVPADSMVIYGHSLGTAPAVELATRVPAAGLVMEGAPMSVRARANEVKPWMGYLLRSRFNSVERIGRVTMPKLMLHAVADRTIPVAHGRRLFALAAEPKRFVELAGRHDNAFEADSALYFGAFRRFLDDLRPSVTNQ